MSIYYTLFVNPLTFQSKKGFLLDKTSVFCWYNRTVMKKRDKDLVLPFIFFNESKFKGASYKAYSLYRYVEEEGAAIQINRLISKKLIMPLKKYG